MPTVSIILPTYNGADRISAAIESIINQSYKDWELIIVDDGSIDSTFELVKKYDDSRIYYIKNTTNSGIQKSLNKGISIAKGVYIARIDDDDIWISSNKLEMQVSKMETDPNLVLIGTSGLLNLTKKNIKIFIRMPEENFQIKKQMLSKNCFLHSSVLIRKSALDSIGGGYSENIQVRHVEDYDLWLKLGLLGFVENIPLAGVQISVRKGTLTSSHRVLQARRAIGLVLEYKKLYPNFLRGIIVSYTRLIFFIAIKVIPLSDRFLYKIQKIKNLFNF